MDEVKVNVDEAMIERIVGDVLKRLSTHADGARPDASFSRDPQGSVSSESIVFSERIITADLLAGRVNGAAVVTVGPRSLVTPAAHDYLRDRGLTLRRSESKSASNNEPTSSLAPLLIVVRNTPAVDRLWQDVQSTWKRELLGCPDDAAKLAISAITRGEASTVVILAEQTHRAACLSNRNEKVKAVAVSDGGCVGAVRKQLRANVWCIDPSNRSWFELRRIATGILSD